MSYLPSVMPIIGYGGSEVTALGETNISIKIIDLAEGDVNAFMIRYVMIRQTC